MVKARAVKDGNDCGSGTRPAVANEGPEDEEDVVVDTGSFFVSMPVTLSAAAAAAAAAAGKACLTSSSVSIGCLFFGSDDVPAK